LTRSIRYCSFTTHSTYNACAKKLYRFCIEIFAQQSCKLIRIAGCRITYRNMVKTSIRRKDHFLWTCEYYQCN